MTPTSPLYDSVVDLFQREGWQFAPVEGREIIRCGFEAQHTRVNIHLQVFAPMQALSVVSESDWKSADQKKRVKLAELAMRVNRELTVGNFEMDWEQGQLVFRVTNLFPEGNVSLSIIKGMVHTVISEMDRIAAIESQIHQAEGTDLLRLNLPILLSREDLLPPVPDQEQPS